MFTLILGVVVFSGIACSNEPVVTTTTVITKTIPLSPEPPPDPEEIRESGKCEDLVEVGVLFVENMVQSLQGGLSVEVLTGQETEPPDVQMLREVGEEMDRRAAQLDCNVDGLNADIVSIFEGIESTDPVIELFLEIIRSGVVTVLGESAMDAP